MIFNRLIFQSREEAKALMQKTSSGKVAVPVYLSRNTSSAFRDGLGTR